MLQLTQEFFSSISTMPPTGNNTVTLKYENNKSAALKVNIKVTNTTSVGSVLVFLLLTLIRRSGVFIINFEYNR